MKTIDYPPRNYRFSTHALSLVLAIALVSGSVLAFIEYGKMEAEIQLLGKGMKYESDLRIDLYHKLRDCSDLEKASEKAIRCYREVDIMNTLSNSRLRRIKSSIEDLRNESLWRNIEEMKERKKRADKEIALRNAGLNPWSEEPK